MAAIALNQNNTPASQYHFFMLTALATATEDSNVRGQSLKHSLIPDVKQFTEIETHMISISLHID